MRLVWEFGRAGELLQRGSRLDHEVTRPLRVLSIEDDEDSTLMLVREMERGGYAVTWERVETPEEMEATLERTGWDVVMADYNLPRFSGLGALALLKQRDAVMPFIIISGSISEELAIAALKVGADDYVFKHDLARVVPALERGMRAGEERRERYSAETALRRSEEAYRELVENANDVVFTVDVQGNFTSLNAAGEQISGYSRQDVTQMNMAQVLAPESLDLAREMIRQKLTEDRPTVYELEIVARDGHRVPLELSTRLIQHDGVPVGIQGIARDITERRKAAQALRESEARYRGLFENASDIVYTHDLHGNFTSINRATERTTGYSQAEILDLAINDIVVPEHLPKARAMIQEKLANQMTTTYELDILSRDGRRVSLEINSQLIFHGGVPVGVQGIARDVTERLRNEADLRARERKQAAVAELGRKALANPDPNALFETVVFAVADTLGVPFCTITELLPDRNALLARAGVGWTSGLMGHATVGAGPESQAGYALLHSEPVVVDDVGQETRFVIPAVLYDHSVRSGVSVIIHGDERPFGVLSAFALEPGRFVRDDVHFLEAVANVLATAIGRAHMEEERARHATELATRVLAAQEEERKRIARELHDETAQSLSTLLINLDLLEPHISAESPILKAGFERVRTLARRTLDETRALSHDLRPTILDDVGLVAALQWFAAEYEKTYGGMVEVETPVSHPSLNPEVEVALFRIAQEALTNTGKHARAEHIRVALRFGPRIHLVVEDDGVGFDRDHVPGPTRQGRLGLYGMHERAALLGGSVTIDTAPGKGTRVVVEIPLHSVEERELTGTSQHRRSS